MIDRTKFSPPGPCGGISGCALMPGLSQEPVLISKFTFLGCRDWRLWAAATARAGAEECLAGRSAGSPVTSPHRTEADTSVI